MNWRDPNVKPCWAMRWTFPGTVWGVLAAPRDALSPAIIEESVAGCSGPFKIPLSNSAFVALEGDRMLVLSPRSSCAYGMQPAVRFYVDHAFRYAAIEPRNWTSVKDADMVYLLALIDDPFLADAAATEVNRTSGKTCTAVVRDFIETSNWLGVQRAPI